METTNQPIETYLPIFRGFYGSYWDEPDFYGEAEHYKLPDKFYFSEFFNYRDYQNELSRKFCDAVESELSEFIESVVFQSLWSPKEYNFKNDSINCLITPKIQEITTYLTGKKEQLSEYLETHLKSRSGSSSFYSYSWDFWNERTEGFTKFDTEHLDLGFFLQFICEQEEITEECLHYTEVPHVSEFYTPEFYELIEMIESFGTSVVNINVLADIYGLSEEVGELREKYNKAITFVQDHYRDIDFDITEAVKAEFSEEGTVTDCINFEALVKKVMNEIESNTLKLEL